MKNEVVELGNKKMIGKIIMHASSATAVSRTAMETDCMPSPDLDR